MEKTLSEKIADLLEDDDVGLESRYAKIVAEKILDLVRKEIEECLK